MSTRRFLACAVALVFALAAATGCGRTTTVTGQVTYEGEPVPEGTITFLPADGKGPSAGGSITGGRYSVSDLTPGPKIVQVVSVKRVNFPHGSSSREERAKMHGSQSSGTVTTSPVEPADLIPAHAAGNNVNVEVRHGTQTCDFCLTRPSTKPR